MRRAILEALCAIALFAACASDKQNAGTPQNLGTANPPDRSKPMNGITAAYTAFRTYAAGKLGIPVDQVEGGPNDEALGKMMKTRVGSLWAFAMKKPGDKNEVRGWATDDGTVITLEQNLGLLFAEAGVWGGGVSPPLTDREIADRLLWTFGPKYVLYPGTKLTLENGVGTFVFTVNYRESGPGGVGGGPPQLTRVEIALTADHHATATQTRSPTP